MRSVIIRAAIVAMRDFIPTTDDLLTAQTISIEETAAHANASGGITEYVSRGYQGKAIAAALLRKSMYFIFSGLFFASTSTTSPAANPKAIYPKIHITQSRTLLLGAPPHISERTDAIK
jgi:hypothetical protein